MFYKKFQKLFLSHKTFIVDTIEKKNISFKQLFHNAIKISNFLTYKENLRKGDTVIIKIEHSSTYYEIILACAILGIRVCPLSQTINAEKYKKIKALVNPSLEITSRKEIYYSTDTTIPKNFYKLEAEQEFLIIFSSGTTSGTPKGIVHTLGNLIQSAENFSQLCKFKSKDIFYAIWPQFYMAGIFNLFFVPLISKSKIILNHEFKVFLLKNLLDSSNQYNVSQLYLTPTMCSLILNFKESLLKNFKFKKKTSIISTSSILYPSTYNNFFEIFKKKIIRCYGVTELGGSLTIDHYPKKNEDFCVGKYSKNTKIKCTGSKKTPKEIFIKSKYIMNRYINGKINSYSFFKTGDIGYIKKGKLYILGRSSDNIKKGGEFVSLAEIESLALNIDGVKNAMALPIKDEFFGSKIKLVLEIEKNLKTKEIENKIILRFNQSLNQNERPDSITFVKNIKKTPIGKNIKYLYS